MNTLKTAQITTAVEDGDEVRLTGLISTLSPLEAFKIAFKLGANGTRYKASL